MELNLTAPQLRRIVRRLTEQEDIMKVLKLTPEQALRVSDSFFALQKVLNNIKTNKLEGQALASMKTLEESVQHLEVFRIIHC
jgi:hypothetical protein